MATTATTGPPTPGHADDDMGRQRLISFATGVRRIARAVPEHDVRMDAVRRMAQNVAHDFNNVLATVLGNLQLLRRRAGDDGHLERMVATAIDAALRGMDLTNRLHAFAHHDDSEPQPVDVNAALKAMDGALRRTVGSMVEVTATLADDTPPVDIDPAQFESTILSLVANARNAMPTGGTLSIETAKVDVGDGAAAGWPAPKGDVGVSRTFVCISVRDTGCGMTPDLIERAFEPFFTTKPGGRACGLGLSVVSGFVNSANGHIAVDSTPGRGTVFCIFLPPSREHAASGDQGR